MEREQQGVFRGYAWSYFVFHADQRMKTFNFFLIVAGLLSGGIVTFLRDGADPRWVSPLGVVLTFLSLVFWQLDRRNRQLVQNGENAIRHLDSLHDLPRTNGKPHVLEIVAHDDYVTEHAPSFPKLGSHWGYSRCLRVVFGLFGALGLFFAIGAWMLQK